VNRIIIILLLIVGCGDIQESITGPEETETRVELDVYMKYEQDSNGFYRVKYNGYNYVQVFAQSEGLQRVFWSSSDSFSVVYQGITFYTSIASYSTYTNGQTGETRQNVFISPSFVGDTLVVVGAISEDNYDWASFILE
jgi:hypothetical protein|tara:strand:- start:405 stop:821 length:417 start_codon:yes stop_codon:yes gene_type:complete